MDESGGNIDFGLSESSHFSWRLFRVDLGIEKQQRCRPKTPQFEIFFWLH
jgi:hypothetical protein